MRVGEPRRGGRGGQEHGQVCTFLQVSVSRLRSRCNFFVYEYRRTVRPSPPVRATPGHTRVTAHPTPRNSNADQHTTHSCQYSCQYFCLSMRHLLLQGKAAAAAAAAAGIPLIGRPVVKNAKDAKTSAPAAGGRQRATTTASGMPIIGRPVVSAAVPTVKVAKAPGLGDSPQAPTQQQQQQQAGPSPAGQQQSTMAAAARMGTPGPQTPGQTMQVHYSSLFFSFQRVDCWRCYSICRLTATVEAVRSTIESFCFWQ